ncbi:hypothetical protein ACFL3M_03785, partial [Patescibacteria group bacterium]
LGLENHYSYVEKIFRDYSSKILAVILVLFGTYQISRKGNRGGLFISSAFWVILIMAVFFWKRTAGEQYIYFIKPFQVILISAGIYGVFSFLRSNLRDASSKIAMVAAGILLLILPNYLYLFSDNGFYNQTSRSENPNYKQAFSYFLRHKNEDDVLVTREFRNYYFEGANVDVVSLGGERSSKDERRLTEKRLSGLIENTNACVWVIVSENDMSFVTKEAEEYMKNEMHEVKSNKVRGTIGAYTSCLEE